MLTDLEARELFHLVFLERLLSSSQPGLYVLKGGVNLRFFFQSPRYSEDMDLDVRPERVAVETLRKNGYKLLRDGAFRRVLAAAGIVDLDINEPRAAKQTDTTQRFRVRLVLSSGQELPTKVEFSRRRVDEGSRVERIDPEVARRHGRTAYLCEHYGAEAAARQKVRALAGRVSPQGRDLFDLHLLDSRIGLGATTLANVPRSIRKTAADAVASMTLADYEGHVIDYLADAERDLYRDRFPEMQDRIFTLLSNEGEGES